MSTPVATGLTIADVEAMPPDPHVRRELIAGELFVSPKGVLRHDALALAVG